MTNFRLRDALSASGLTQREVADELHVDPKTVERWVTQSRTPYPRHRHRLAACLGENESYLWPNALAEDRRAELGAAEVVHIYAHRSSVPSELWSGLLESTQRRIDMLVYAGLFLVEQHPHLMSLLREKADTGTRIRLLLGDPDCGAVATRGDEEGIGAAFSAEVRNALAHYHPLDGCPGVDVRLHRTTLYASIFQFDDDLLVNPLVHGLLAAHSPLLHLRRLGPGDLFETYIMSFERIWQDASPAWPASAASVAGAVMSSPSSDTPSDSL